MNALILAVFAVLAMAAAAPASPEAVYPDPGKQHHKYEEPIAIVNQESEANPDGSYKSTFETANGITQNEQGSLKIEGDKEIQVARGFSSYKSPDGTPIHTEWYADETGYHAAGDHLPVAPEIPVAIARALEWSIAHPYKAEEEFVKALPKLSK